MVGIWVPENSKYERWVPAIFEKVSKIQLNYTAHPVSEIFKHKKNPLYRSKF